ncbi:hypothetical protein UFOVP1492_120 [uncultured Caudovirales phage]|uniref:Uncharacterized protein n=1 Tax=uncultured Caudovirales phage TaxID=2100421 RepID=A0A6J5RFV2_9CAUD|nr:hypothetical protein UFOVP1127_14 [uncultured Caudovirales phage]CAB4193326.1 hypothetical protein UFOVP1242_60 [uncultured Caudovirales phage]CAB4217894.1 hypothetical protein UFOVP1492_120 [uncultured Caudovirales phage]CAB5231035.1 hypothetical protein UFOVP1580_13 [uncultured Caudovirales phage]
MFDQSAPKEQIKITAGDTFAFGVRPRKNGVPETSLVGWTITSDVIRKDTGAVVAEYTVGDGIVITAMPIDPDVPLVTSPVAVVTLLPIITDLLNTTKALVLDVQLVNPDGYKLTYINLTITAEKDITKT